jgi:hypothetical protein
MAVETAFFSLDSTDERLHLLASCTSTIMTGRRTALVGLALVVGVVCLAAAGAAQASESQPFPQAGVRFEQNATDGDVEVVFEVTGPDDGLTKLSVVAPDGRTVVDFTAPDATKFGIREFVFESPEPRDVDRLKAAYPAGEYAFHGTSPEGVQFAGTSKLSHELPPTVAFLHPTQDAEGVEPRDLMITWTPVDAAAGYVVELEQSRLDTKVVVRQPAAAAKFAVPNGLLVPGTKYALGIGAISAEGNISFVETHFTTAGDD